MALLADDARKLVGKLGFEASDLACVGVSAGGPMDREKGILLSPPNLPGWDRIPVVELLQEKLELPARLENDANAGALAEWRWGAGRGFRSMVFLTFGTGLGAGLILDGRLYAGVGGMAGEVGHIRLEASGPVGYGKAGSLEGFCSGGGIAQLGRIRALEGLQRGRPAGYCPDAASLGGIDARLLAEAAFAGDRAALEVYAESGRRLGRGLSALVDILNPEAIVIGGIFRRAEALLRHTMEEELGRECLERSLAACAILPAALGDSIGDAAALAVALDTSLSIS